MSELPGTTHSVDKAIDALNGDGVIAYPTEAVFGLGCDPRSKSGLEKILNIKGRELEKGFILIAAAQHQLLEFLAPIKKPWQDQFDQHWPGPVTFVVPASQTAKNSLLSGYRETLAVRVSNHPVVVELCLQAGTALVSTSANRSGEPALRSTEAVIAQFPDDLDAIVDAPVGSLNKPTPIIDVISGERLR